MDPLASDAGITDLRDREYIERMVTLVRTAKTLNPLMAAGSELVLGKTRMPVDTLHGKLDSEARAEQASKLGVALQREMKKALPAPEPPTEKTKSAMPEKERAALLVRLVGL